MKPGALQPRGRRGGESVFGPGALAAGSRGRVAKAVMDSRVSFSPICGKLVLQAPESTGMWAGQRDTGARGSGSEILPGPRDKSLLTFAVHCALLPDSFLNAGASPLTRGRTATTRVGLGPSVAVTRFCLCLLKLDAQSDRRRFVKLV